jgi:hypothetical protein
VGVTLVNPGAGKVGKTVEIFGKGFSSTPSSNAISFNGVPAVVAAAAPNRLATSVPAGATTGLISVTVTGVGSANSPSAFTVIAAVTVSPTAEVAPLNVSRQFQALLGGSPTSDVVWSVNGVTGGNATVGTISTAGLYTAPSTAPAPPRVTVTASHKDDRTANASATVTIIPGQGVTIGAAGPTGGVSIQFANQPPAGTKFLFLGGICVVEGGVCIGGDVSTEATSGQVIGYMKTASGAGTVAVYRSTCYSSGGGSCTGWGLTTEVSGSPEGYLSSTLPASGGVGLKLDSGLLLRGLTGTQNAYLWTTAP